jgi:hypothetical protein
MMASNPTKATARFSLRVLLLTVTALSLIFAVCTWNIAVGLPLAIAVVGVLLVVMGMRMRRRAEAIVGCLLVAVAVGLLAVNPPGVVAWVAC